MAIITKVITVKFNRLDFIKHLTRDRHRNSLICCITKIWIVTKIDGAINYIRISVPILRIGRVGAIVYGWMKRLR
jgi:hypothetical protein